MAETGGLEILHPLTFSKGFCYIFGIWVLWGSTKILGNTFHLATAKSSLSCFDDASKIFWVTLLTFSRFNGLTSKSMFSFLIKVCPVLGLVWLLSDCWAGNLLRLGSCHYFLVSPSVYITITAFCLIRTQWHFFLLSFCFLPVIIWVPMFWLQKKNPLLQHVTSSPR